MKNSQNGITEVRDRLLTWIFTGFAEVMIKVQPYWERHKIVGYISIGIMVVMFIALIACVATVGGTNEAWVIALGIPAFLTGMLMIGFAMIGSRKERQ